MKSLLIIFAGCSIATSIGGFTTKTFHIKGPEKDAQKALQSCTYYKATAAGFGKGFNYTCTELTTAEKEWIIKKLNDPALINQIIDDKLIAALTTPKNELNDTLKNVLLDFKGLTAKKVLKTLAKMSTMQKLAEVLPQLMGQEY